MRKMALKMTTGLRLAAVRASFVGLPACTRGWQAAKRRGTLNTNGRLTGSGGGLERMRWLLAHEVAAVRRPAA